MKSIVIFIAFILIFVTGYSQNLTGEWQGEYLFTSHSKPGFLTLIVRLKHDGTYTMNTYSLVKTGNGSDTVVANNVLYQNKKNHWTLTEDSEGSDLYIPQIFYLTYKQKKGNEILRGNWKSKSNEYSFSSNGPILFKKVK